MAKVGTAHLEIKPVLNEDALAELGQKIQDVVARAVALGIESGTKPRDVPAAKVPADKG